MQKYKSSKHHILSNNGMWAPLFVIHCKPEMNTDSDLNPTDFQLCDGFGFYKFCLTGIEFDLNLIILFWTSQLSVLFRSCRLLHLILSLLQWSFSHLSKFYILFVFGSHTIQWCKVHACSRMYHVIKVKEFVWLSLIPSLFLTHDRHRILYMCSLVVMIRLCYILYLVICLSNLLS